MNICQLGCRKILYEPRDDLLFNRSRIQIIQFHTMFVSLVDWGDILFFCLMLFLHINQPQFCNDWEVNYKGFEGILVLVVRVDHTLEFKFWKVARALHTHQHPQRQAVAFLARVLVRAAIINGPQLTRWDICASCLFGGHPVFQISYFLARSLPTPQKKTIPPPPKKNSWNMAFFVGLVVPTQRDWNHLKFLTPWI